MFNLLLVISSLVLMYLKVKQEIAKLSTKT